MMIQPAPVQSNGRTRLPLALAVIGILVGVGAFAIAATVGPSSTPGAAAAANAALDQAATVANPGDGAWQAPAGFQGPTAFGGQRGGPMMGGGPGMGVGRGWMMGGAITITKIDGSKLSLTTVDGWIRTIDATGATITKAGKTITVAGLAVGDQVVFREARQSNGSFTITSITVVVPEVAGTVKAVSGSTVTITLRDGSTQDVIVTSSTTFTIGDQAADKSAVTVGSEVIAQGTKAADGTFTALTIDVQPNRLLGTVTATTATSITVKTQDGTSVVISVDSKTTFRVNGVTNPTVKDIATGAIVVASGRRTTNTTFQAISVWAFPAGTRAVGPGFRGGMGSFGGGFGRGMGPGFGPFGPSGPATSPTPSAGAGA